MIQITCKGNSAICTRTERLTSGMVGLQCEFMFDDAWDGLAKTAVFTAGNEKRDVLLTGAVCTVPWEVLKTAGYQLVIGVYGTNAEGTLVIPTVYAMCGGIASGADPSGDESTDPTLPVWGQMQGMIGNLAELATTSKDNLVAAINEAAQSGGGSGGTPITEQTISDWGFTKNTGTYSKPSGGIPKTDLADDVQASLSKANSALQEHQDVSGKQDTLIQSGASVGQIAKITAVDSNGKPTAWEPVDMPSGGSGGGSKDVFRLLRTITTTEEVSSIDVSTDDNGKTFSCKKVWCRIVIKGSATNSGNDYLRVNLNADRTNTAARVVDIGDYVRNNATQQRVLEITAEPNAEAPRLPGFYIPCDYTIGVAAQKYSLRDIYHYAFNGQRFDTVTSVCAYSKTGTMVFGVGSTVELWGVDA